MSGWSLLPDYEYAQNQASYLKSAEAAWKQSDAYKTQQREQALQEKPYQLADQAMQFSQQQYKNEQAQQAAQRGWNATQYADLLNQLQTNGRYERGPDITTTQGPSEYGLDTLGKMRGLYETLASGGSQIGEADPTVARNALLNALNSTADMQRFNFGREQMPGIDSSAAGAGQFGSTRHGIAAGVALGSMEQGIATGRANAMSQFENQQLQQQYDRMKTQANLNQEAKLAAAAGLGDVAKLSGTTSTQQAWNDKLAEGLQNILAGQSLGVGVAQQQASQPVQQSKPVSLFELLDSGRLRAGPF